jgi:hypothetical protein
MSATQLSWKDSIYLQREQLARLLREPIARLAENVRRSGATENG